MARFFLLIILMLASVFTTRSQDQKGIIYGKIQEDRGDPVSYANVILLNQDSVLVKADYSREDGSFEFKDIPSGTYQVKFSSLQYQTYITDLLLLQSGQKLHLNNIVLDNAIQQLNEVEIKATRPLVDIQPDKMVFNVAGSVNATGDDGLELLKKAPGVVVDNNDNIMLQGKNGVRVYIDGRPSRLSGDDLVAMLRSMQAEGVDAIEIITNPPAKYEAEGNAGIINIKLKRDKNLGYNATFNAGYNYGKYNSYRGGLNLNYRNQKINVFGNYNYNDNKGYHFEYFDKEMNGYFFDQQNDMTWNHRGHNFRLGADYFISSKHLIGFIVHGNDNSVEFDSKSTTPFGDLSDRQVDQQLLANSDRLIPRTNINTNINYQFTGEDDSKLNIDADYGYFTKDASSYQINNYMDATGTELIEARLFTDRQVTSIDIYTLKADYERKLGPGNLSLGGKISDIITDNGFDFYKLEDHEKILDRERSNDFNYDEQVSAAYINYAIKVNDKLNLNGGLRVEKTYSKGVLQSIQDQEDDQVGRNYTDLFPSGGLAYQLDKKNKISVNYSRRIDRPNYENLNPFEFKLDELTYRKGNPFLKPQYTNNFQLSHAFNQKLNTQLSYSVTSDYFAQVTDTIGGRASMISEQNIATAKNLGLNMNLNHDLTKWWNAFINLNLYHAAFNTGDAERIAIDVDQTTYNIYLKNNFIMPGDISLELSGWYNSPSVWGGTFRMDRMWSMNLGLKKSIMNDKGTINISLNDIFKTANWNGRMEYGGLVMDGIGGNDSRQLRVGFTYRIGNQKVKGARRRTTGLEEEKNRLGSSSQ
ncbi:MAG: TonB-dependent receptor domain-containing protein [Candidatus Cyclobacteriaceae bacterium M3_2C_046]